MVQTRAQDTQRRGRRRACALLLALAAALPARAPARAARLRVTVGGADFRPYPVAVPDLVAVDAGATLPAAARELSDLLQADIDLARSLELVAKASYLAPAGEPVAQPVYPRWSAVGAAGLVRGTVAVEPGAGGGTARLALRFFDVAGAREVLARTCTEPVPRASRCIHRFVDDVVEALTGEPGIFSSRIAFVRRVGRGKAIFTAALDGDDVVRVTDNDVLNLLPSWEPGGGALLFTSFSAGNPDLYRLALGDRRTTPVSQRRGLNTGGTMSPDGRRIALTLSLDGNTEIYVMDVGGAGLRRLTDSWGQDVSPTWSPDGRRIAFVSSRSGNPHIYVMDADGGRARRLTFQGTYNQEPDWSPRADGQIAFTARDERLAYDIFLVHPETGVITRLTQDESSNESPTFSPDGHHLAFISSRGAGHHKALWVMDVDGRAPRQVVAADSDLETPAWGPRLGY